MENIESNIESATIISAEQRKLLMDYLKANSDTAQGEELVEAGESETQLANDLLNLNLPRSDAEPNAHYEFADSNYSPDEELRNEAFQNAGLDPEKFEIRRHDFRIEGFKNSLKVINVEEITKDSEGKDVKVRVEGGIVFLGKVIFENDEPKYINLTSEEIDKLKDVLLSLRKN